MKTLTFSTKYDLPLSDQLDVLGDLTAVGVISGWVALSSGSFLLRDLDEESMAAYLEDVGGDEVDQLFTIS